MEDIRKDELNTLLSTNGKKSLHVTTSNGETPMEKKKENKRERRKASCWRHFLKMEKEDVTDILMWRACIAEFLATFLLCFYTIGVGCHMPDTPPPSLLQVAIFVAFFLTALIAAFANVSGCHINPAITLAFAALRHVSLTRAVLYVIFQCAGGVAGSIALRELLHPDMVGQLGVIFPGKGIADRQALGMEFAITGFLMFMAAAVLDKGRTDVNYSIPFTISITVGANIILAGGFSGAGMNPARAIGPAVAMGIYEKQWIYWVGPIGGAVFGALLYDKVFSVGASFKHCLSCCEPGDQSSVVTMEKEAAKMFNLEWKTEHVKDITDI